MPATVGLWLAQPREMDMHYQKIAVVGAAGKLGRRVVNALRRQGAETIALVRPGTHKEKTAALLSMGAQVAQVELADIPALTRRLAGVDAVVSTLAGLKDVMVDGQRSVLEAAEIAGVQRIIPSDYCLDFTRFPAGQNRNLDLRREFNVILEASPVAATSVFCGSFSSMLTQAPIILDIRHNRVSYWEHADQVMNFTAIDDVAQVTAAAALDTDPPRYLRVAGTTLSAREIAAQAAELKGHPFALHCMATLNDLSGYIEKGQRTAFADAGDIYPMWQTFQDSRNLFNGSGVFEPIDNGRYPQIGWTPLRELISRELIASGLLAL